MINAKLISTVVRILASGGFLLLTACGDGGRPSQNTAPVFTSDSRIAVPENNTATGYTATATDADGDTVTFSLSGGVDQAAFMINSISGELSFITSPDFETPTDGDADNSYAVEISATDRTNTVVQAVTITVTNVNDVAPVFTSGSSISVPERTTITAYTATASDVEGDNFTFRLSGGADRSAFALDTNSGVLSFNNAADFETPTDSDANNSYVVEITVTDGFHIVSQTVTVNVININDITPVFTSATSINVPENTTVTGYSATATDVEGDTVTFSLSGGADQSSFGIDTNSGVLSFNVSPDFEVPTDSDTNNSYIVEISASDGINGVAQTVTVNVADADNEAAPVFTSGASISVAENTTTTGYTATATDADGDTITFSLSGGVDQAAFSIDTNSGVLSFISAPDFEVPTDSDTNNNYLVEISASDGFNSTAQTVTVTVINVNDVSPVFTSAASISVAENTTTTGYTATATDADGDTITFSLSGGVDQAAFSIDTNSGVLSFVTAPDFEIPIDSDTNNSYIVEISASDGSTSVSQTVTVTVTDVGNEGVPVFTSGTSVSVPEDTTVTGYTATATDVDGDTITFSLSGGADQSSFSIDANSGVLSFNNAPNFDAPSDNDGNNDYEVEISASDGSNSVAQTVTVTVIDVDEAPNVAATPTLGFDIKTFRFTWTDVANATFYRILENPDGLSGFTQISGNIALGIQTFDHIVALYLRMNASYILQSCNNIGCTDSGAIAVTGNLAGAIGSFRFNENVTSDLDDGDVFGWSLSLSNDGTTMAVGAYGEASNAIGIDNNDEDNSANTSGAVYIFTRNGASWTQQAYIKASNTAFNDRFGHVLSLSGDGNTLAVGAHREDSNATGLNNDETNNGAADSGAVYVYTRSGTTWSQQAYVKASNTNAGDEFGYALSLSNDGNTLAVGAYRESSNATVIDGDEANNDSASAGAVYVFTLSGITWSQQAYIKASNTDIGDFFGAAVTLSGDGNTLAAGAYREDSNATVIGGDETDNSASASGAAYVFTRSGATWSQQAYLKASNAESLDRFGYALSLSGDGNSLAVGAYREGSNSTGINNDQTDNTATNAGAVYVFNLSGTTWSQQAYIKASNTDANDEFGFSVSLSDNGDTLAVGAHFEDSNAIGIGGDETLNNGANPGAVYVFTRSGVTWMQQAYVKSISSLTNRANSEFAYSLSLSGDGNSLAGGAPFGYSINAGAVFLY